MDAHEKWKSREVVLLDEAKKIYRASPCFDPKVNLETIGERVYDLMDEECWVKFRKIETRIKAEFDRLYPGV